MILQHALLSKRPRLLEIHVLKLQDGIADVAEGHEDGDQATRHSLVQRCACKVDVDGLTKDVLLLNVVFDSVSHVCSEGRELVHASALSSERGDGHVGPISELNHAFGCVGFILVDSERLTLCHRRIVNWFSLKERLHFFVIEH